jgi:hypothetical protein
MGLKEDIQNTEKYNESDRSDFAELLRRYNECDVWAKDIFKDVGVLLTSHPGNRAFLKSSVETHKKLGYWLTLVYDNYLDPDNHQIEWNHVMPDRDVMDMVDTFIMPHHQTWGGVLYPYFWLLKFGVYAMSHFKYIYCANGDFILEKPENFPQILELLGDGDIMPCGWEKDTIMTSAGFIGKSEAVIALVEHMQKYFIPLSAYEEHSQEMGNCESRMGLACIDLGLKIVKPEENPFNDQHHVKGHGTWYKILGFRHIHGEFGYAYKYKKTPPELKYFDMRHLSGSDRMAVEAYWKDEDKSVLEDWWHKG